MLEELAPAIISIVCIAVVFCYAFVSDPHRVHKGATISRSTSNQAIGLSETDRNLS